MFNESLYAHGLIGLRQVSPWVRPADWPALPTSTSNEIDILAAVFNESSNYVALQATVSSGTYTVNWGDGSAPQTYTSGTTASYQYSYSASGLGPLTAEGYKTAPIKVTPTTGGATITGFNSGVANSSISVAAGNPYLDMQINAPNLTSLTISSSSWPCGVLRHILITAIGAITSLYNTFFNCYSLQSITFPSGSLASVTTLTNAFAYCYSLRYISFPTGALGLVNTTTSAFLSCVALARIINCAIPISFSVASCNLSAAALNEIYTALPTVTAQTITRTGNVGAGSDTPSIATAKGWVVV